MKKTNENLSIAVLKAMFNVEYGGLDQFKAAVENGVIEGMIRDCADAMYGGDLPTVLRQLARNVSSYKTNAAKRPMTNSGHRNVDKMVAMYDELIHSLMPKQAVRNSSTVYSKPAHMLTTEDIDAIDDLEVLRKRINSLADYLCKGFSGLKEEDLTGEELAKYQQVKTVKAYAQARRKELLSRESAPVQLSDSLAAKLSKTGKVSFTLAELDEIRKLLNK